MPLTCLLPLSLLTSWSLAQVRPAATYSGVAKGVVFEDRNGNGKRDQREPGIAGVYVSNQREFTKTDSSGRWQIGKTDDMIFYVVKPRGWMTPVDEHQTPRFYYIHKPNGSRPTLKYSGVKPTGPLPDSIDFPLHRRQEANTFAALFFGDTQPRDLREVDYISRDIVEPIIKGREKFDFGVTLGDVAFDDLSVTDPLVRMIGLIGIPWYYVLGNHDINYDVPDDEESDEFWEGRFGPNYYSFNHGPTHFVVLDNIIWTGSENAKKMTPPRSGGFYTGGIGPTQMEWLRKDLATVPPNQLVVLLMHVPMNDTQDKLELYKIVAERPYALSVSAHTHYQEHRFIKQADGWPKAEPHHHVVNVTTCGSWWQGAPDVRGVPHTTMRDGAPNGYSVFTFDGNQYKIEYRAARRKAEYQMNIISPDAVEVSAVAGTPFHVNVFGGSERSKVEYSFAGGPWIRMDKVEEADPMYAEAAQREKDLKPPFRPLPAPIKSPHLWKAVLLKVSTPGVYPLHVRTTDMFGQVYIATRAIRVVDVSAAGSKKRAGRRI
jgi:hypothetical protein